MNVMTEIHIDTGYYRNLEYNSEAVFRCYPATTKEDEINISFVNPEKKNKEEYSICLVPEQVKEFIWALNKMLSIAEEFHAEASPKRKKSPKRS